jgi:hypothetical protein
MNKITHHFQLGETLHRLLHYQNGSHSSLLVRVHGNEKDAGEVGVKWVQEQGGLFVDVDNPTREINFKLNDINIQFDPNRVFSITGIKKTLQEYESLCNQDVVAEIGKFQQALLKQCEKANAIVALHNNEDFNIHYYGASGENALACDKLHINNSLNPHNFIIVTQLSDFRLLKELNLSVVLECQHPTQDSGSLSEYCLKHNVRYFNIEAQFGCFQEQWEMLSGVMKLQD